MKFIGGQVCLDFVNTVGGRVADAVLRDKLSTFEDLLTWSQLAGLFSSAVARRVKRRASYHPGVARRTLARAVRLREALYRIFKSHLNGLPPARADLDMLARELSTARLHERLTRFAGGFGWTWDDQDGSGDALDGSLWRVARAAGDLLTSSDLAQLRQCGGDECGWMFLDTSRNRSRRWCDMKDCGNRAKVRRFRQMQQRGRRIRK